MDERIDYRADSKHGDVCKCGWFNEHQCKTRCRLPPQKWAEKVSVMNDIMGHLGAARNQRSMTDDKIIAAHIDVAYELICGLLHTDNTLGHH